jgi:hypothetical protein
LRLDTLAPVFGRDFFEAAAGAVESVEVFASLVLEAPIVETQRNQTSIKKILLNYKHYGSHIVKLFNLPLPLGVFGCRASNPASIAPRISSSPLVFPS